MGNCAGIDWASEKHDVLIEDPAGEALLAATFRHDEDGVSALSAALVCFDVEVVAIERPDGLLVDRLLDAGLRVLALHPNKVAAARDRFRVSGGKSDRFDAFVLCELAHGSSSFPGARARLGCDESDPGPDAGARGSRGSAHGGAQPAALRA